MYETNGAQAYGPRIRRELKDSHFDGYEYKGYRIKTKLAIEGRGEYKPLKLANAHDVYDKFKKMHEADKERFYSVLLDNKNKVIGVEMVSQGDLSSAPVNPREVYKSALLASAAAVIFVHAHPSGDPEPSFADKEITHMLRQAGELMGVNVLDHVIIGRDAYYSFADKGDL
jgi:DNA repair protein RadC